MELQKKKRGENWSAEEKDILRQLVSESAHIIEDKSTKTIINIKKTKEWKNLGSKFNEITGKVRSVEELKLAWKRMKLSAKANISAHRKEQTRTGGGEKPPSPSAEDLEVMAIAPHDFLIEVNNYDSDAMFACTTDVFVDPIPGPSQYPKETISGVQAISNQLTSDHNYTQTIEENTEPIVVPVQVNELPEATERAKRSPAKQKKRIVQNKNRSEQMRQSIVQSNTCFKNRQLEMMEVEHKLNIKIAQLKIKKLELEIAVLQTKRNSSTE